MKRQRIDEQKVRQAMAGDKEALDELLQQVRPKVRQFVLRWIDDAEEAEDVAQEALMKASKQIKHLRNPYSFEHWLLGIAKNCCKMWLRSKRLAREKGFVSFQSYFGGALPDDFPFDDYLWQHWEKRQTVESWLSTLPSRWATAMRLRYLEGYTEQEIAQQLGVPITTVVNDIHRAKQKIKEAIGMPKQKLHEVTTTVRQELPVKERLPIVIYGGSYGWQWHIQGSDGDTVQMEVTKKAWGWIEQEAKKRQQQIVVKLQQVDKLSLSEPFEVYPFQGQAWSGTSTKKGKPQPVYAPHEGHWQERMQCWHTLDPASYRQAQEQLTAGALLAVIADDGLKGLEVPEKQMPEGFPVRMGYPKNGERMAFGPDVTAQVHLTIPYNLPLFIILVNGDVSIMGYKPVSVEIPIVIVGGWGSASLCQVESDVKVLGDITLSEAKGLKGKLTWRMASYLQGVSWGDKPVRRTGPIPTALLEDVRGGLDIEVRCVQIAMKDPKAPIRVVNEFGKTELWLTDAEMAKTVRYELRSISGDISVFLTPEVDKVLRIHLFTECGAIDRSRWRQTDWLYNTPHEIFIGTVPNWEQANFLVFNRAGNIKVVYATE